MSTAPIAHREGASFARPVATATRLQRHRASRFEIAAVRLHLERGVSRATGEIQIDIAGVGMKFVLPFRIDRSAEMHFAGDGLGAHECGGHVFEHQVATHGLRGHFARYLPRLDVAAHRAGAQPRRGIGDGEVARHSLQRGVVGDVRHEEITAHGVCLQICHILHLQVPRDRSDDEPCGLRNADLETVISAHVVVVVITVVARVFGERDARR